MEAIMKSENENYMGGKNGETELVIVSSLATIWEQLDNLTTLKGLNGQDTQAFNKSKEDGTVYSNLQGKKSLSAEPYDLDR
ncbi:hypothetical protein BTVI_83016 [Pitangus sulphuratus]|nr:hypothetical protein BTVI_83016 [Pitangus sulphuratus]